MKRVTTFTLVLCLLAVAAGGCALVSAGQRTAPLPAPAPTPSEPKEPEPVTAVTLTLYFANADATQVAAETREVTIEGTLAEAVINQLIEGPREPGLHATLPEGTRLLGLVIQDGIAYVDFSQEFKTNHWGGSAGELMTIQSIVASLTELEEVDRVQLLVAGEKEEAILGHGCTLEPIEPAEELIRRR